MAAARSREQRIENCLEGLNRRPTPWLQVAALKSREAGSENVLRVAKETLDARKRQIKTLTVTIKRLQYQMGEGRGQIGEGRERPSDLFPAIHRPGEGSLAGLGLSGTVDEGLLVRAPHPRPPDALEYSQEPLVPEVLLTMDGVLHHGEPSGIYSYPDGCP